MKVTWSEVNRLRDSFEDIRRDMESLKKVTRRIILIGIMLNLIEMGLISWLILHLFAPFGVNRKMGRGKQLEKKPFSFRVCKKPKQENTLVNILEVVREVGMDSESFLPIPLSKSFFGSSLWSFGADQCASSEGFLVTLTPGGSQSSVRIHVLPMDFLLEDSRKGSHFDRQPKENRNGILTLPGGQHANLDVGNVRKEKSFLILPNQRGCVEAPVRESYHPVTSGGDQSLNPVRGPLRRILRRNVMNPADKGFPRGFLVALNPTDEGRIGTGRKPLRSSDEGNLVRG